MTKLEFLVRSAMMCFAYAARCPEDSFDFKSWFSNGMDFMMEAEKI